MKRFIVLALTFSAISVFSSAGVFAADEGGLSYNMDRSRLSLGLTAGTIFNELTSQKCTHPDGQCAAITTANLIATATGTPAETSTTISTYSKVLQAKVGYALSNNINLFGVIGFSDLTATKNATFNGNLGPLFGVGVKYSFFGRNSADISLNAQYEHGSSLSGSDSASLNNLQVAANFSNKIGNFVPFMGIKFNYLAVSISQGQETTDYKSERFKGFSFYGGFDYFVAGNIFIHNEIHNLGEDAIYVGMGFLF